MPVLQPIGIRTRNRSRPARVVVWPHDAREWQVAELWEYTLPRMTPESSSPAAFDATVHRFPGRFGRSSAQGGRSGSRV